MSRSRLVLLSQLNVDMDGIKNDWLSWRVNRLPGANVAEADVEARFIVRDEWQDRPLGYQMGKQNEEPSRAGMYEEENGFVPELWANPTRRRIIYEYCPEIKMILPMEWEESTWVGKGPNGEKDSISQDDVKEIDDWYEEIKEFGAVEGLEDI